MPEEDGLDEQGLFEKLLESNYGYEQARQTMRYIPREFYSWGQDSQAEWIAANDVIELQTLGDWGVGKFGKLVLRQMGERAAATVRVSELEKQWALSDREWERLQVQLSAITQQRNEIARQRAVAERFSQLSDIIPTTDQIEAPFLEGATSISPRFRQVAEQRLLPDIFKELGMPEKRRQTFQAGLSGIAQRLLPETAQDKELMALKHADPWAQLLSQPTFLQQLEQRFRSLTPQERGFDSGRFSPMTRFLG